MKKEEEIEDIEVEEEGMERRMGYVKRVEIKELQKLGNMGGESQERIKEEVRIMEKRNVDFELEGEMRKEVEMKKKMMEKYKLIRMQGKENVIVKKENNQEQIEEEMLKEMGGEKIIGKMIVGIEKKEKIVKIGEKD